VIRTYRQRPVRAALIVVAMLALIAAGCVKKKEEAQQATPQKVESPPNVTITNYTQMPDLELKALDGTTVQLSSLRGNIVIISFLATWNKECASQVSALNELQAKLQRYPFSVLGVFTDKDGKTALQGYVQKNSIRFSVYYNGDEVAARLGGFRALPTTYILLRDGSIYDKEVGRRSMRDIDSKIKEIMGQRL
jgi:peroxiredoxin